MVLLILLPFAGALDVQPVEVIFQAPLIAESDVDTGPWEWLVLFVDPLGTATATGAAESPVDVATIVRESAWVQGEGISDYRQTLPEQEDETAFSPGMVGATASDGWTSIVIEGAGLTVRASSASASIDIHGSGAPLQRFGTRQPHNTALRWEQLENRGAGTWMRLDPHEAELPVVVEASSIQSVEWHGWDLSCQGDCGNAHTDTTDVEQGPATLRKDTHRYVRWSGDLSLNVEASAWLVVAGSTGPFSLDHTGVLRLPSAESSAFNATGDALRLDGTGTLSDIRVTQEDPHRLVGTLQGSYAGIQLGETSVDLSPRVAQAATVAVVVLLPFLLRWLWLFARSDRLTEAQEDLAEALRVAPGSSYRDLLRITGFSNGTLDWHLRGLERRRLVAFREYKNTKRFFWGTVPPDWKRIVVTAREDLCSLLDWVEAQDSFVLVDAVDALETSRSTIQGWLAELVDAEILHTYKDGRQRIYQVAGSEGAESLFGKGPVAIVAE